MSQSNTQNKWPHCKHWLVVFFFCSQVLFNQFKYFYNLYFLLLACSQFIKELRLGALYTYWVPLVCGKTKSFFPLLLLLLLLLLFITSVCVHGGSLLCDSSFQVFPTNTTHKMFFFISLSRVLFWLLLS